MSAAWVNGQKYELADAALLKRVRVKDSFAPSGLPLVALSTHGLRRGPYSFAALRLGAAVVFDV